MSMAISPFSVFTAAALKMMVSPLTEMGETLSLITAPSIVYFTGFRFARNLFSPGVMDTRLDSSSYPIMLNRT